ncbi:MAG TPA: LCP family protein [Streptosporangiaceae bacterium]
MSEDWPKGWYRDEDSRQPGRDADADRTQTVQSSGYPGWGPRSSAGVRDSARGGTAWPAQPPARTGGGGGGSGYVRPAPRGGRRWLRPKRILIVVTALVLVLVLVGVGLYYDFNSKLSRAAVLVPTSATSAGTNWLITGSDGRGGLTGPQENAMALGRNITGSRSDTIMLLHMPANGTRPTLVSIPRDSYVNIPGHGYNKINAAYAYGGPKLLIQTMQNATGLRIDHYMGIGFTGLVSVVNDVGGVNMCLPSAMKDPKAGLNLKKGCQTLNGSQALALVRTRAFANGDLQREEDQRALLKSLLSKMTSTGNVINPFTSIPAASGAASALTVDSGTQLIDLWSVANALRNPVNTMVPFGGYANNAAGSVVLWDTTQAQQMFSDLGNDRALPKSLVKGSSVQGTALSRGITRCPGPRLLGFSITGAGAHCPRSIGGEGPQAPPLAAGLVNRAACTCIRNSRAHARKLAGMQAGQVGYVLPTSVRI